MKRRDYKRLEEYMLLCMRDSAHDSEHVYRVLGVALDIAAHEPDADCDVVIAACLLHDVGRPEQFADPRLSHAVVGARKAHDFLKKNGFDAAFAAHVADCVRTHRFRSDDEPATIEAKIVFDADKVDVCGALGVARTIFYQGHTGEPLYRRGADGRLSDGRGDQKKSFFREYHRKLEGIYDRFYTARGAQIAAQRRQNARAFYQAALFEARESLEMGEAIDQFLQD